MPHRVEHIFRIVQDAIAAAEAERSEENDRDFIRPVDWPVQCTVGPGLEGAIACETKIGYVNGRRGRLVYRGFDVFDLCLHSTFEEVSYLLLHGVLPTQAEFEAFNSKLKEYRHLPHTLRLIMGFPLEQMNPMAALRMGTNLMRQYQTQRDLEDLPAKGRVISSDDDSIASSDAVGATKAVFEFADRNVNRPAPAKAESDLQEAHGIESCYHLIAGMGTLAAAIYRLRIGRLPIEPDPDLSHAANLLYMLTGRRPTPVEEHIMDIALILHADHGMNASTFAAMVVASTLSDFYFSIGAGVAALNGPLHGGANEAVLHTLEEIGSPDNVETWYARARQEKRKVMGFGHRVYKVYDPRARILGPLADYLVAESPDGQVQELFATAKRLETCVIEDLGASKGIFPNVDFYSGIVYRCMGIPAELFTPIFAVARVAGWSARVLEYMKHNRIFRPRAAYVGGFDREYIPVSER